MRTYPIVITSQEFNHPGRRFEVAATVPSAAAAARWYFRALMSSLASPSPVSRLVAGRRSVASRLPRRAASPLAVRRANTTAADDAARPDDDDAPGPAGSIVVHLPAPEIVVVGLGPGDPGQITLEAWDVLTAPGARVFARTAQHPTLAGLPRDVAMSTFDHVYERVQNLQDVYPEIVEELVDAARCAAAAAEPDEDEDEDGDEGRRPPRGILERVGRRYVRVVRPSRGRRRGSRAP